MPFFIPQQQALSLKSRHQHERELEDKIREAIKDGNTVGIYGTHGFIRIKPMAIRVFGPENQGRTTSQWSVDEPDAIERKTTR